MDQTVGTILRQKREEKRYTLEQVFQDTRIRLSYLQAIESDQLDQLPSRAQAHGFIRLYANYLGLDPYPLLDSLTPPSPVEPGVESEPASDSRKGLSDFSKIEIDKLEEKTRQIVDSIGQKSRSALKKGTSQGSQILLNTVEIFKEKIPYEIVRKGESPSLPTKETGEQPQNTSPKSVSDNKSYQVMCKAIGANLREKRESLGLSLSDVERQTRIREIYLYALEEGNLDTLPSTVQGRGMLSNYANFMGLDSEAFLSRFAEALQQKRLETLPEAEAGVPLPVSSSVQPQKITGWRRLLTPDMIFTGSLFLVFFIFIIWGSVQLISINSPKTAATVVPISDVLLASGTPQATSLVTIEGSTPEATLSLGSGTDTTGALESTISATQTGAVQLVIVAHHRAFMQITVDGKVKFDGRVVPGTIYSYSGDTAIELLTGDGSAIEVYYNQTDLGTMGINGQVVHMQFTAKGSTDLGALNTATPVPTTIATLTPLPTSIPPTSTPTEPNSPTPTGTESK